MDRIAALFLLISMAACDTDDDDDDPDEGGQVADSADSADSAGAADGAGCDAAITECALGDLSPDQFADYCDLVLASISAQPGDRFECTETGLFLDVAARDQCLSAVPAATCAVTVSESIDCYKAAEAAACEAFADECAFFGDPSTGCWE